MSSLSEPLRIILSASLVFLLGAISPGPNFVLVAATAARSRSAALTVALGFALAAMTWASMSAMGLAVLLSQVGWAYSIVQLAGGAYLIYLGVRMLLGHTGRARLGLDAADPGGARNPLWRGFATNIANPKSAAFFTSIFATLVPPGQPTWILAAVVGSVGAVSLCWYSFVAVALSAATIRSIFERARTLFDFVFGGFLVILGLRILATR